MTEVAAAVEAGASWPKYQRYSALLPEPSVRAAPKLTPKAWAHCCWSYVRAKADVSVSTEPVITHSGKYSWAVAARVSGWCATGSPLYSTEVAPADLSLAISAGASVWRSTGDLYDNDSTRSTPASLRLCSNDFSAFSESSL